MVIYSNLEVNGTKIYEVFNIHVSKSIDKNNSASSFTATVDNREGIHNTRFSVGHDVKVYADQNVNPPTTIVFRGIVEKIDFQGKPNVNERIILTGRDYAARLQDVTIQPKTYTNQEVSTIVTNIISSNLTDITTTNVSVTGTTLSRILFKQKNIFDALSDLAELSGYFFYIDNNKDLNFRIINETTSGISLDNTNIISSKFVQSRRELYNQVFVYGSRYLSSYREVFTPGTGSVYTMQYKPNNAIVYVGSPYYVNGSVFYGQLMNQISTPGNVGSTQYLINLEDKQIIFVSGTQAGLNIPPNATAGSLITILYDRSLPIVKFAQDRGSINSYGPKVKVIQNDEIKDPNQARDIVISVLANTSQPRTQGTLELKGIFILTPGNTISVTLPNENINNVVYKILTVEYNFDRDLELSERVTTITLGDKVRSFDDTIKQLFLEVQKLKAKDMDSSDTITRIETDTGSVGLRVYSWFVRTRSIQNSFILGHSLNGVLGSPAPGISNGNVVLGDQRAGSIIQVSGGSFI